MHKLLMNAFVLLGFVVVGEVWGGAAWASENTRPNILYFYVDDMGWGSIGPNGQSARRASGKPAVRTPNLDALAARGVNFTRGYGCHVCSPARSSQQSGFHQGHTFADRNDPNNAKKAMRADDVLMGDALSAAGYVTGYWGKWGYGGSKSQQAPVIENIQTLPTSHGYQHVLAELHHVRAHTFFQPTLWKAPAPAGLLEVCTWVPNSLAAYQNDNAYPNTPALQNHKAYPQTAYCDDSYCFAALDFVREQGRNYNATGQPFFGLLAVQIPHAPFGEIASLPNWDKTYADDPQYPGLAPQTRQWAAMVTRIDAHFGNILAALEDPNNDGDKSDSIAANTLVVFQSDNGGPAGANNVQLDANGGLRGNKGKIQEGGIRVPLVMRWPARINADSKLPVGSNCDMVVDVTDLLPTFCELAGAEIPVGVDGVSIAPTLTGAGFQRRRDFIIHEAGNGQSIIRGKYKLVRSRNSSLALFDLEADRGEMNDIAQRNPRIVKELQTLLLGERVTEPRGFANTYHHWIGMDNGSVAAAENWSDYRYANAGVTYLTDSGAPRVSWTARIQNRGDRPNTAIAQRDVAFLGLEVLGNQQTNAPQTLTLASEVELVGRNEVRIGRNGILVLQRATVGSLRWLEIQAGGEMRGSGVVDSALFNSGRVVLDGKQPRLKVARDYRQAAIGTLQVRCDSTTQPPLQVAGKAVLAGELEVVAANAQQLQPGSVLPVLTAEKVQGKFANVDDSLTLPNGTRLRIRYRTSSIELVVE